MPEQQKVWITVAKNFCAHDRRDVVHAVPWDTYAERRKARRERRTRRNTYEAVCGKRFVKLRGHNVTDHNGVGSLGTMIAVWPPPVAWLADDGHVRCRDCWVATGKPRPDPSWKNLTRNGGS